MPPLRGAVLLLLAAMAIGVKGEKRLVGLAAVLANVDAPICRLSTDWERLQEVDMICPPNTYKDDNNDYCTTLCVFYNNKPFKGVTYVNSTRNDDHCIPVCPAPTYTRLASTQTSVTCISCPAGYVGVAGKGCYTPCPAGYPVEWNRSTRPLCLQPCPADTPNPTDDPSTCKGTDANGEDIYKKRLSKARTQAPTGTKTVVLPVKIRDEVDMICPRNSDFFSIHYDDNAPEEYSTFCARCPPGWETEQEDTSVFCRKSNCPDDSFSRCGPYCYNNALPLGDLSEDDCSAFLDVFDCIPDCFDGLKK
ncbi:hypothetical protein ABPG75_007903 [Micractinium tetrahymenae]